MTRPSPAICGPPSARSPAPSATATSSIQHAESREPTSELWRALGKQGFLGINIPAEYGGGAGLTELSIVVEQTAADGCPLLFLLVSSAICGEMIGRYGTAEQRQRWLPPLADGSIKMAFAITEPDAGSNSHRLSTTARRDGDEWLLSGTKYYISGADEAAAILVVARTGTDAATGRGRLSLFLVPAGAPGLSLQPLPVAVMMPERQSPSISPTSGQAPPTCSGRRMRASPRSFTASTPSASRAPRSAWASAGTLSPRPRGTRRCGPSGTPDRRAPGHRARAGEGADRAGGGGAADRQGRLAARP